MIWGSSDLAGIAAYRLLCQLAENAKYPAVNGVLPEALHNQVVTFAAPPASSGLPIRLVLLRDTVEHEQVASLPTRPRCWRASRASRSAGWWRSASIRWSGWPACAPSATSPACTSVLLEGVDPTPIRHRSSS